jgi:signal transduction histidine kinase
MDKKILLSKILVYVMALVSSVIALLLALFFRMKFGMLPVLLVFLPAIMWSAWYGGFGPGFFATLITEWEICYFFLFPNHAIPPINPAVVIQMALFILEGTFISIFIDGGKREDKLIQYRFREKVYNSALAALHFAYIHLLDDIRTRDEFLSIASHELKTPLTSMLLQIQTALHNIRHVSLAEFSVEHLLSMLQSTENQTKRLSRMINDLLNISLLATDRMELEREDVNMDTIVRGLLEDFAPKFEKEGYAVSFEGDESASGFWDRVRIEQAISNLISNAMKYGNKNPIYIFVKKQETHVTFTIMDQGIGIDDKKKEEIFGLFKRAVSSDTYKGLGIGLYITAQIIKLHQGQIIVESDIGEGSTFQIKLPVKAL